MKEYFTVFGKGVIVKETPDLKDFSFDCEGSSLPPSETIPPECEPCNASGCLPLRERALIVEILEANNGQIRKAKL